MRTSTRLFSVLALILFASLALARPATSTSHGRIPAQTRTPKLYASFGSPNLQLDFGTVVRDTADEQSVEPGGSELPTVLRQQSLPGWSWLFIRSWISILIPM